MIKKAFILFLLFSINYTILADEGNKNDNLNTEETSAIVDNSIPQNYQQLKYALLNFNGTSQQKIPRNNYRAGDDYLMLYVAGGVLVVTAAIVLINGTDEYSNGLGQANTGIIIGGGVMSGLIVTKYFVDKNR